MKSCGVLLLSTLVVGSFSRPQQDQHNYEMELQGGRELLEPRLGAEGNREKLVLIPKCDIWPLLNVVDR